MQNKTHLGVCLGSAVIVMAESILQDLRDRKQWSTDPGRRDVP